MRRPVASLPPAAALALRRYLTPMVMQDWHDSDHASPAPAVAVEYELDRLATVWVAGSSSAATRWARARLGGARTQDLPRALAAAVYVATHSADERTREAAWYVARTIRGDIEQRRFAGRAAALRLFDAAEAWLAHHYGDVQ